MLPVPACCAVGMPWPFLTWHGGPRRPLVAASLLLLHPRCFSRGLDHVCPWGCAGNSRGGGTRREGGKLSWKQVTCARSVVGMGVAMETASPNSILHPTPGAWLP